MILLNLDTMGKTKLSLIDPGAEISVVSMDTILDLGLTSSVKPTRVKATAFSGGGIALAGVIKLKLKIGDSVVVHKFYVTERLATSTDLLIGIDLLRKANTQLNLTPGGVTMAMFGKSMRLKETDDTKIIFEASETPEKHRVFALERLPAEEELKKLIDSKTAEVRIAKKTHLPANTVSNVRVELCGTEAWKGDGLFEARDITEMLEIPHQLIKVREAEGKQHTSKCRPGEKCRHPEIVKYAFIRVYNKGKVPLVLKKNKDVGIISKVKRLNSRYVQKKVCQLQQKAEPEIRKNGNIY